MTSEILALSIFQHIALNVDVHAAEVMATGLPDVDPVETGTQVLYLVDVAAIFDLLGEFP
jgi:hypothetical protein